MLCKDFPARNFRRTPLKEQGSNRKARIQLTCHDLWLFGASPHVCELQQNRLPCRKLDSFASRVPPQTGKKQKLAGGQESQCEPQPRRTLKSLLLTAARRELLKKTDSGGGFETVASQGRQFGKVASFK